MGMGRIGAGMRVGGACRFDSNGKNGYEEPPRPSNSATASRCAKGRGGFSRPWGSGHPVSNRNEVRLVYPVIFLMARFVAVGGALVGRRWTTRSSGKGLVSSSRGCSSLCRSSSSKYPTTTASFAFLLPLPRSARSTGSSIDRGRTTIDADPMGSRSMSRPHGEKGAFFSGGEIFAFTKGEGERGLGSMTRSARERWTRSRPAGGDSPLVRSGRGWEVEVKCRWSSIERQKGDCRLRCRALGSTLRARQARGRCAKGKGDGGAQAQGEGGGIESQILDQGGGHSPDCVETVQDSN